MLQVKTVIESNHLWGIMLTKNSSTSFFIVILNFIFNLPLFVRANDQHRRYVHVSLQITWFEAQRYCREHHTDLITFRNKSDLNALQSPCNYSALCWIGLQRDGNDPHVWNWSDGEESSFKNWNVKKNQPDNHYGNENCVVMGQVFWHDLQCDSQKAFLCYEDNPILVKENKTWEEALEHCRTLNTDPSSRNMNFNHLYDLPHMNFVGDNLDAKKGFQGSQTPEVWIGLRFLAGTWLWVNEVPLQKQLPACPAPGMYCGTMSKTGELLPLRDCLERRNFFCSLRH